MKQLKFQYNINILNFIYIINIILKKKSSKNDDKLF